MNPQRWSAKNVIIGLAASAVSACGGGAGDGVASGAFPERPYATVTSDRQRLRIEIRTSPGQPPARGVTDVELTVLNESGAAQDGLAVSVTPWMPAMGHGSAVIPSASPEGGGKYLVGSVGMYMSGRWELRTSFTGAVEDTATPVFDVP